MGNDSLTIFLILTGKLFSLEDRIFGNNVSGLKKLLLAIGIPKIDYKVLLAETEVLYEKYEEIVSKHKDLEGISETYKESLTSLMKLVNALYKKSKAIDSLSWGEYQELVNKYKGAKAKLIRLIEAVQRGKAMGVI